MIILHTQVYPAVKHTQYFKRKPTYGQCDLSYGRPTNIVTSGLMPVKLYRITETHTYHRRKAMTTMMAIFVRKTQTEKATAVEVEDDSPAGLLISAKGN